MPRVALLTALSILIWECKSFALGINTALCNRRQPTGWTQITREKKTTHRGSRLFGANNEDTLGQQDSGLATPDDLDGMRVSELKKMAQTLGLGSTSDCFEKKDLVERVRRTLRDKLLMTMKLLMPKRHHCLLYFPTSLLFSRPQ